MDAKLAESVQAKQQLALSDLIGQMLRRIAWFCFLNSRPYANTRPRQLAISRVLVPLCV